MIGSEDTSEDPKTERAGPSSFQKQAPLFDLRVQHTDALTCVELLGELDLSCEDRFGDAVDPVKTGRLMLDLRGLTFIDSSGLRLILRTWRRSCEEGFALDVVGARDQVEKALRITGLDEVLPMVDQVSLNGQLQSWTYSDNSSAQPPAPQQQGNTK